MKLLWDAAPDRWLPGEGEVQVFAASLEISDARHDTFWRSLSEDERQRAGRFHFARDRRRFVAARGTLREILSRPLDAAPEEIRFTCNLFGKPRLHSSALAPLHFNVSHSESLAVYAMGRRELGVDVERMHPMDDALTVAARFFSEPEIRVMELLPSARRVETFFECWTRHEACLKAAGLGLNDGANKNTGAGWTVLPLRPAEGFMGALALTEACTRVWCWSWEGADEHSTSLNLGASRHCS